MLLHHNSNRFRPFQDKSKESNSINSQKKMIFAIFSYLGHLSGPLGPQFQNSATCVNAARCYPTVIGSVLDHFQPNQKTQIGLGVQKVCVCIYFLFFLSVKSSQKGVKKKFDFFFDFFLLRITEFAKKWNKKSKICVR